MDSDRPHYIAHHYADDQIVSDFTYYVDERCDAERIAALRALIVPKPGEMQDWSEIGDLFYCQGTAVTLLGSWVIAGSDLQPEWHAGGWAGRTRPSRENALRFLHELGRPA
jgi:hypothetical protein